MIDYFSATCFPMPEINVLARGVVLHRFYHYLGLGLTFLLF